MLLKPVLVGRFPAAGGAALAVIAAILFGISTPLIQRFGAGVGPFATAALLYVGAAFAGLFLRKRREHEARLIKAEVPTLLAVAAAGSVIAPVALAWGLQRTSGTSASLALALEALFTAILAAAVYRESMGRRVWSAMFFLLAGGVVLIVDQSKDEGARAWGLLAVLVATAAWGIDNMLSRKLAERDPGQVVVVKGVLGSIATSLLAVAFNEALPPMNAAAALFAIGATGYGLSLRFYLLAQRAFGAARTGSVFAFAPFIGAALAAGMGDRSIGWLTVVAGALMLVGVLLHLTESHAHEHSHHALEHEHAHRHDDDHHDHVHVPMPSGAHSHWHRHDPLSHAHAHVPDAHHSHEH